MAVRIRMKRLGRKHRPFYRICIMDAQKPRNGRSIEEIGHYDPMVREKSDRVTIDMERVDYWLSVGAQPTEKVNALIRKVRQNKWGSVTAPPPMTAPKPLPEPEPEAAPEETAEESAETETAEAPTETASE